MRNQLTRETADGFQKLRKRGRALKYRRRRRLVHNQRRASHDAKLRLKPSTPIFRVVFAGKQRGSYGGYCLENQGGKDINDVLSDNQQPTFCFAFRFENDGGIPAHSRSSIHELQPRKT